MNVSVFYPTRPKRKRKRKGREEKEKRLFLKKKKKKKKKNYSQIFSISFRKATRTGGCRSVVQGRQFWSNLLNSISISPSLTSKKSWILSIASNFKMVNSIVSQSLKSKSQSFFLFLLLQKKTFVLLLFFFCSSFVLLLFSFCSPFDLLLFFFSSLLFFFCKKQTFS